MPFSFSLPEIRKAKAERTLFEFVRQAWPIVEPTTPFIDGPHIRAICLHLEAVSRGEIRKLLINIPPRHAKSLLVSVFWPCWQWIKKPECRWMFASYNAALSIRDALKMRRIVESPWYQANWGETVKFMGDQNAKTKFENTATGYRMALGVGGSATGDGGDITVVDDPHNVLDALSDKVLQSTCDWHAEAWSSRLNDPKTGCRVVIGQRVSEKDVSQQIIDQGDWCELILPMRYEPDRHCVTAIGWEDWRKTDGELLWPQRFGEKEAQELERSMGSYAAAAQLQQRPAPRGGGMYQRGWFEVIKALAEPSVIKRARIWDFAATQDGGDWSTGMLVAKTVRGQFIVEDIVRLQGSPFRVRETVENTAKRDGHAVHILIPQDPGQAGADQAADYIRRLAGYVVHAIRPSQNKATRAAPAAAQAEAGNIKLMDRPWVGCLLDELSVFPNGRNDDQVDTLSDAINYLAQGGGGMASSVNLPGRHGIEKIERGRDAMRF